MVKADLLMVHEYQQTYSIVDEFHNLVNIASKMHKNTWYLSRFNSVCSILEKKIIIHDGTVYLDDFLGYSFDEIKGYAKQFDPRNFTNTGNVLIVDTFLMEEIYLYLANAIT